MRHSIKGLMLSGLVFPGLGQIMQRNYIRGMALILTVSWCVFQVTVKALQQMNQLLEQIQSSGISISTDDLFGVVVKLMPDVGGPSYRLLFLIFTLCWLVSIVDAFLVGLKMDKADNAPPPDLSDSVELNEE